ncbi:hypothetical protein PIB30_094010 [Stylosanthes scabra]|uniref:Uncharacterized protein n=1 Tax=Stylosanthes scabra TaxID=79078 RepID=A0ABU6TWQ5_9FABA|nr:hypothetical protein [Stylosanthes scabra]
MDTAPSTKKKIKELVKHTARKRNREGDSSREKIEEDKARRKIEHKCASVDDLISKLKAFKGALHNNKKLNTHLKAPTTIAPSRILSYTFARTAQSGGTSVRPRGGIGYFRTKFGLASRSRASLNTPLHVSRARTVPPCVRTTAQAALG